MTSASDSLRDGRERAVYSGLASRLATREFVPNLAIMYYALEELADLSLELQKRCITIPVAHRSIARQVMVFDAMCGRAGHHLKIIDAAMINPNHNFTILKGIALYSGQKCDVMIKREQFFRSLRIGC